MRMHLRTFSRLFIAEAPLLSGSFLVALASVRVLFLFAKHLFVAARRHIVFARHFAVTILLPLRKFFSPTLAPDPISKRKNPQKSDFFGFLSFRFLRFASTLEA